MSEPPEQFEREPGGSRRAHNPQKPPARASGRDYVRRSLLGICARVGLTLQELATVSGKPKEDKEWRVGRDPFAIFVQGTLAQLRVPIQQLRSKSFICYACGIGGQEEIYGELLGLSDFILGVGQSDFK